MAKHAVLFLQHFIIQSRAFRLATNAILKNGEEMVQTTLLCIAVYSQRTQVDVFADVFVALNKKYPAELIAWLKVLEVNEFPTPTISAADSANLGSKTWSQFNRRCKRPSAIFNQHLDLQCHLYTPKSIVTF